MPEETLTGKFNATNVVFNDTPAPDAEQSFNPDKVAYVVDAPVHTQTPENKNFKKEEKLNELDLNQAKKEGGSEAVARIKTGQDHNPITSQEQKDKKDREFNSLLERLKEHRLWLLGMMDAIQDKIDGLTQKIEDCSRVIEALQDFKDGKIALGEDGYPANDKAREAIKDWERKNGKKWEPGTEEGVAALDAIILSEDHKRADYIEGREHEQKEWDKLHDKWEATDEIIREASETGYIISNAKMKNDLAFADRLDELKQHQEQLEQENNLANNAPDQSAEPSNTGNSMASATDIFNSAPGV